MKMYRLSTMSNKNGLFLSKILKIFSKMSLNVGTTCLNWPKFIRNLCRIYSEFFQLYRCNCLILFTVDSFYYPRKINFYFVSANNFGSILLIGICFYSPKFNSFQCAPFICQLFWIPNEIHSNCYKLEFDLRRHLLNYSNYWINSFYSLYIGELSALIFRAGIFPIWSTYRQKKILFYSNCLISAFRL